MTTTERTTALGGDEAAEQRSAPNPDAGVVGDLVEAAKELDRLTLVILSALNYADKGNLDSVSDALTAQRAALAKYATLGAGEPVAWQRYSPLTGWAFTDAEDLDHYRSKGQPIRGLGVIATHQPAISTDSQGSSAKTPIPGGDASNGAADHEGAGK